MKKVLFLSFCCILSFSGFAQHCVWDMNLLLALDITTQKEPAKVPNLKISYLDKNGKELKLDHLASSFWKNPPIPKEPYQNYNHEAFAKQEYGFWFAKEDSYVSLVSPNELNKIAAIKIEDIDKAENGRFKSQTFSVKEENFFSLCIGNNFWVEGDKGHKPKGFQAMKISLEKNEN